MSPRLALFALLFVLTACRGELPPSDPSGLPHVELRVPAGGVVRIYRTSDVDAEEAEALLYQVAAVCSEVQGHLGFRPPRTELVVYRPTGPIGVSGQHVRETRADLIQETEGWRIRFAYPWRNEPQATGQLLGTTAHEIAEATILLRVTVLDPYLRWLHDGIAELVEHEVLRKLQPAVARENLRRMLRFVRERREDGVERVDLSRWRQLAPYLVRSHRFLGPGQQNLTLNRLPQSLRRVRNAMITNEDPVLSRGLTELEAILQRARRIEARPWPRGDARPDDPLTQDFLFYNAAFGLWLGLERNSPGTMRRTLHALAKRREEDDHVLRAEEALELVQAAARRAEPPPDVVLLADLEAELRREQQRLR